jgi:hypothetical protein
MSPQAGDLCVRCAGAVAAVRAAGAQ